MKVNEFRETLHISGAQLDKRQYLETEPLSFSIKLQISMKPHCHKREGGKENFQLSLHIMATCTDNIFTPWLLTSTHHYGVFNN